MSNKKDKGPSVNGTQKPSLNEGLRQPKSLTDAFTISRGEVPTGWTLLAEIEGILGRKGFRRRVLKEDNNGHTNFVGWGIVTNTPRLERNKDGSVAVPIQLNVSRLHGNSVVRTEDWNAVKKRYPELWHANGKEHRTNGHSTHECVPSLPFQNDEKVELDIIVDNNIFSDLGAPREKGKTWLDLIRVIAMLPNVRIIIPSVIADYECRGLIPQSQLGEGGKVKHIVFDNNAIKNPSYEALNALLSDASRIHVGDMGQTTVLQGNPKIVIMESPEQRDFYNAVIALKAERLNHYKSRCDNESNQKAFADIHRKYKDIGEENMLAYGSMDESKHPVLLLSNDITFFKNYFFRHPHARTRCEHEIMHTNTYGFLEAIEDACLQQAPDITTANLFEWHFGEKETDSDKETIAYSINKFRGDKGCVPPKNKSRKEIADGRSLTTVLAAGIKMLQQERSAEGVGGADSWAGSVKKPAEPNQVG